MENTINLFLEFDNTLFDGNLHDILTNYLSKYKDNQIPGLTKKQLQSELTGEKEVTELSKKAIQEAIKDYEFSTRLSERYHTGTFFEGNRLNEIVGNFKKLGINVILLSSSPHKAIQALYDIHHLDHLKNLQIQSFPANYSLEMKANSKINIISQLEGEAFHKGSDKVVNFLVDSSKSSIDAFLKNRNPDFNTGMHIPKGLNRKLLRNLEKQVISNTKKYRKIKNERPKVFSKGLSKYFIKKAGLPKADFKVKMEPVTGIKEPGLKARESDRIKNESKESYTYTFSGSTNSHVLEKVQFVLRNDQDSTIENFKIKNKSDFDVVERGLAGTNETMLADIALRLKKDNSRITSVTIEGKSGMFQANTIEKDMINEILMKNGTKLEVKNKDTSIVPSQKNGNENAASISSDKDLSAMTQALNKEQLKQAAPSAAVTAKKTDKSAKSVRFKLN